MAGSISNKQRGSSVNRAAEGVWSSAGRWIKHQAPRLNQKLCKLVLIADPRIWILRSRRVTWWTTLASDLSRSSPNQRPRLQPAKGVLPRSNRSRTNRIQGPTVFPPPLLAHHDGGAAQGSGGFPHRRWSISSLRCTTSSATALKTKLVRRRALEKISYRLLKAECL